MFKQQQLLSRKMIILNSNVPLGFLAFLLVSLAAPRLTAVWQVGAASDQHQQQLSSTNNNNNNGNSAAINNGTNPYWRRPGCHRVGHTRTISIPGCVKFNLSTNACRGYCMSYSIPATEDHGPLAHAELDHEYGHSMAAGTPTTSGAGAKGAPLLMLRSKTTAPSNEQQQRLQLEQQESRSNVEGFAARLSAVGRLERLSGGKSVESSLSREQQQQQAQSVVQSQSGGGSSSINGIPEGGGPADLVSARSHNSGGGGSSGQQRSVAAKTSSAQANSIYSAAATEAERREVVSIGQCCNMMETEDVLVNLRCGASEIRRLVFKSAKTCECFFCKHV